MHPLDYQQSLTAQKIVNCKCITEHSSLHPSIQIVAHTMPDTDRGASSWRVLPALEATGLLKQQKRVAMRRAPRGWRRPSVVGHKRFVGGEYVGGAVVGAVVGACSEAWLEPMEHGAEKAEGREGCVEIEFDDYVRG
jgi:hypothetical protein